MWDEKREIKRGNVEKEGVPLQPEQDAFIEGRFRAYFNKLTLWALSVLRDRTVA